jgi:hypothetical protein
MSSKTKPTKGGSRPTTTGTAKDQAPNPEFFQQMLYQYEAELKTEEDPVRIKEISRHIRNLKAIINCLRSRK